MSLSKNLQKARRRAHMSQAKLGIECGWDENPQGRVSHYETGRTEPSLADLKKMASALGVTLMELLEGCDDSLAGQLATKIGAVDPKHHDQILTAVDGLIGLLKAK